MSFSKKEFGFSSKDKFKDLLRISFANNLLVFSWNFSDQRERDWEKNKIKKIDNWCKRKEEFEIGFIIRLTFLMLFCFKIGNIFKLFWMIFFIF